MKRLVSILLLVFGVTTSFAQSSTPDYVQKAKVGLNQYYPQFKDYFEPIFMKYYEKYLPSTRNIINYKIQKNLEIFEEEIATDRDKCATILIVLDKLGDKTFKNSKKQVDSSDGEDLINEAADEIYGEIISELKKGIQKTEENIQNKRERVELFNKRNEKLKEIISLMNNSTKSQETTEKIVIKIEELFNLNDVGDINDDVDFQKIIKEYINLNKQINRRPSAIGQKFVDEYNRITKSK